MIGTKTTYQAVLKSEKVDDLHKYQVLPAPVGNYPYRLPLHQSHPQQYTKKMVFHMVGDTGGVLAAFQDRVALQMAEQCYNTDSVEEVPAFLYHLGDLVYHYGEAKGYEAQFLKPFDCYPAPIYAIAGNHDTDINPDSPERQDTLEAFCSAFCNTSPVTIHFGGQSRRKSQVQPHVFWTMESPLAVIIGLHTNVPKYGYVNREQRNWFIKELRNAAENHSDKALIVCMHHAPYSADVNHGSSKAMIEFLETAFAESAVKPDVVFSGHVHNYQRFSKHYTDGKTVPYIVAGAGGFDELHQLAAPYDPSYQADGELFGKVQLDNYCDDKHGFLKIRLEKTPFEFSIKGTYYTISDRKGQGQALPFDQFSIDLTGR